MWFDAVDYCRWLTEKTNRTQCYLQAKKADAAGAADEDSLPNWDFDPTRNGFRLPTEAEWEYACRAGTITPFSCGSDESLLGKYARFRQDYADLPLTVACGAMRPNLWGLFDMHGNAWEWCTRGTRRSAPQRDPVSSVPPCVAGRLVEPHCG